MLVMHQRSRLCQVNAHIPPPMHMMRYGYNRRAEEGIAATTRDRVALG